MNTSHTKATLPPNERKKLLIAQGAVFRSGIAQAGRAAQASLRPKSLVSHAFSSLASTAMSFFNGKGSHSTGLDLAAMLPLVVSGASALSKRFLLKRSVLKPVFGSVLVLGAIGAVMALVVCRKKARATRQMHPSVEP